MKKLLLVAIVVTATRGDAQRNGGPAADSAAVVATASRFQAFLAAGDSLGVVGLLADDLLVQEAGSVETRAEYLAHHLGADIAASKGRSEVRRVVRVTVRGDLAYLVSQSTSASGGAAGAATESAELMILSRSVAGWRVSAIHWSSRRRRPS